MRRLCEMVSTTALVVLDIDPHMAHSCQTSQMDRSSCRGSSICKTSWSAKVDIRMCQYRRRGWRPRPMKGKVTSI